MHVQDWRGHLKESTGLMINGKIISGQMSAVWSVAKGGVKSGFGGRKEMIALQQKQ